MDPADNIQLRPIEEADLDHLRRLAVDREAVGEFEWTGFSNPQGARRRWEKDGWIDPEHTWLAVARGNGAFAGIVTWRDRSLGNGKATRYELGIVLLPDHRGHGVGTRAQQLLVDYLFETTPVHRLEALTETENLAEQRVLEKLGFRREGVLREAFFRGGRWRDSVLYAHLRSDP
jgi:[ribosomal protein S5]-alanine N-acetyltransferase